MRKGGRPNIVFIMLDTLRADCLRHYGGDLKLPAIDAVCDRGTVYANAVAPGTYTLTSHLSLFTGKRVRSIEGLRGNAIKNYYKNTDPLVSKNRYIKEGDMTLAKRMASLGYSTSLFSNNPFISPSTGLGSGFSYIKNVFIENKLKTHKTALGIISNDTLREGLTELAYGISLAIPRHHLDRLYLSLRGTLNRRYSEEYGFGNLDQGAALTNKLVDSYLSQAPHGNKFLFLNYMEAHEGYPIGLVTKKYVSQDKWLYVSNIAGTEDVWTIRKAYEERLMYLDGKVKELLEIMKERGVLDNAVVVMTSDHGQAFMEHGQMFHTLFPYNEISKVPLVTARFIDGKQIGSGRRIEQNVSLSALGDAIVGLGYGKEDIDGSLRKERFVFSDHTGISEVWDTGLLLRFKRRSKHADRIYKAKVRYNTAATAIYSENYKLLHFYGKGRIDELYDLAQDPGELENIIKERRDVARSLLAGNVS
jgi:arylsulfatase A-like enzyme